MSLADDTEMLKALAETKVSGKGKYATYLKPRTRSGRVVITGFEANKKLEDGRIGNFLNMRLISHVTAPPEGYENIATNTEGELVSKQFFLKEGKPQKKAAIQADLLRCAAEVYEAVTGEATDARKLTENKDLMVKALKALEQSEGVVVDFRARDSDGGNTYHDLVAVKNTKEQVMKRRQALASGTPVTE